MVSVEIVPGVGFAVVGIAVDVADTASARRQNTVVPSIRRLHSRLPISHQVVGSTDSWPGCVPEDDIADYLIASRLCGKAADSCAGKAGGRTGLIRKVALETFPTQPCC